MVQVQIRTPGREYPVLIGSEIYAGELSAALRRMAPTAVVVVSHESIIGLHGSRLLAALACVKETAGELTYFLFPEGEEHKSLANVERGYLQLLKSGFNREGVILAFGGGVVGDLAGFLAATYMRGTRLMQIPTTLMAMVDSSVGGKVGVDLPGAKNAVGSFYQPQAVFSDVSVLNTLPERDLRAGLAEVAKYGLVYDAEILGMMRSWSHGLPESDTDLISVVVRSVERKAAVVARDERDMTGERALLNYGHTFGHALESAAGYGSLRHGEAVAIGMMMAARLSELYGLAASGLAEQHRRILIPLLIGMSLPDGLRGEALVADMRNDKKRGRADVFVLLEELQKPCLVENPPGEMILRAAVETLEELGRA